MKTMWKRGLALLFALALMLTLAVPALAEEPESEPEGQVTGGVKHLGGGEEQTPEAEYRELYVSKDGSDETGDGSEAAPFRSLARAAREANKTPEIPVYVLLLTDLEARETACFVGRELTIQAAAGTPVTVKRAQGFLPEKDEKGNVYNPAMVQLRAPSTGERSTAGTLTLVGVVLDDAGRHEGSLFEAPATPAPVEPAPAAPEAAAAPVEMPAPEENAQPASVAAPEESEDAPAAEPAGEEPKEPAAEQPHSDMVQDAIVSLDPGGSLILSTGAELRNFGGRSAVQLGEKGKLTLEAGSAIRDTQKVENERKAVSAPESATIETFEGAKLEERSPAPVAAEAPAVLQAQEGESQSDSAAALEFTAPETVTRIKDSVLQYPVNYTLTFTVSERIKTLVETAHTLGAEAEVKGSIVITLDSRLTPDLSSCVLESSVFELDGEPKLDGSRITAQFKLKEDWAEHMEELTQPMTFTCSTTLSAMDFKASTAEQDEFLISTAMVSLEGKAEGRQIGPYDTPEKTAKTKMLGLGNAAIVYDPNGGVGGPAREDNVSPQKEYPLKTSPAPTHENVDGTPVVFLGWTETKDEKIYANGEDKPATVTTLAVHGVEELPDLLDNTQTVYAVYGYDTNGDGVADIDQVLATLRFDPNGGENAPEPIVHVVGSTESGDLGVNIPEQEPNRDYYTFLGWGESADATKNDKLYKYDSDKEGRRDIPVTQDKTLYAVWEKNYQINYDANGGTNAPAATVLLTQTKTGTDSKGNPVYTGRAVITSDAPTRSGYSFQGWATSRRGAAAYFDGDEVEISGGNVTLYAVWARSGSGSSTSGGSGSGAGSGSKAPKTGDPGAGYYGFLLGGSALALGAAVTLWRKKKA